jgi:hypothetical protein
MEGLFAGSYTFELKTAEFGTVRREVEDLEQGETRLLSFALALPSFVSGRLVDSDGNPVAEQWVSLLRPSPEPGVNAPLQGLGNAELEFDHEQQAAFDARILHSILTDARGNNRFQIPSPGPRPLASFPNSSGRNQPVAQ